MLWGLGRRQQWVFLIFLALIMKQKECWKTVILVGDIADWCCRAGPYQMTAGRCRICKSSVHQPGSHYCQGCAYKKGLCDFTKYVFMFVQLWFVMWLLPSGKNDHIRNIESNWTEAFWCCFCWFLNAIVESCFPCLEKIGIMLVLWLNLAVELEH